MEVQTDSERVRHSRRLVLELLGSSVDLSLAGPAEPDGDLARYADRYGADADAVRAAAPRRPAPASATRASRATTTRRSTAATRGRRDRRPAGQGRQRPVRPRLLALHPLLQVRRGLRRGRPEHVRDRRRRPRVRRPDLDRVRRPAARSPRASTAATASASARPGALMFQSEHEMREAGTWAPEEQTVTDTICPYCGVGCTLSLHVQDNAIVKVTSPPTRR